MYTYQLAVSSAGNFKWSPGNYYPAIIMTSKLNLIKIRLINFDFGKRLKILRVFADAKYSCSRPMSSLPWLEASPSQLEGVRVFLSSLRIDSALEPIACPRLVAISLHDRAFRVFDIVSFTWFKLESLLSEKSSSSSPGSSLREAPLSLVLFGRKTRFINTAFTCVRD